LHLNKFLLQQSQKGAYASYLPHFLQGKREINVKFSSRCIPEIFPKNEFIRIKALNCGAGKRKSTG